MATLKSSGRATLYASMTVEVAPGPVLFHEGDIDKLYIQKWGLFTRK